MWEKEGGTNEHTSTGRVGGHARSPRNPNGFTSSEVMGRRFYFFSGQVYMLVPICKHTEQTGPIYISTYKQTNKATCLLTERIRRSFNYG